jgi:L-amino acid N-acyltransferase YncA
MGATRARVQPVIGLPYASRPGASTAAHAAAGGTAASLAPLRQDLEMRTHPAVIRPFKEGDLSALFDMYSEVVLDGGAMPAHGASLDVFVEGWIRNRSVFVAWQDEQIVGSYFVRSNFPAFAADIAQGGYTVCGRARRQGVGRLMVEDSMREARRLGYRSMMFNLVLERNPSRFLYENLGFEVIGRIPDAKQGEDGLIYWRSLADVPLAPPA